MADFAHGVERFLRLVRQIEQRTTRRSEIDLTSRLGEVLEGLGLHTVIDTAQSGARTRPDILAYRDQMHADLLLHADVVFEAKKPDELAGFSSLAAASVQGLWREKTVPYILQNLSRIQYYVLTTFVQFAIVRITDDMRAKFALWSEGSTQIDRELRDQFVGSSIILNLGVSDSPRERQRTAEWIAWTKEHFHPDKLARPALSKSANTVKISTEQDLEKLASKLAALASGVSESGGSIPGIFTSVRRTLSDDYGSVDADVKRDLHLFAMAQSPSHDLELVRSDIEADSNRWLDEFVAASVHSLVSRLFVLKVIEDVYGRDQPEPLLDPHFWVLNTDSYDDLNDEDTVRAVEIKLKSLSASGNPVVTGIAVFGAFYDWITKRLDPVLFRTLLEQFVVSDLRNMQGDLLGRFFEIYAQRVNKTRRRALGQYYTPLPVVRFMWSMVDGALADLEVTNFAVLDPAMGSGTFLAEGARYLEQRGGMRFWERMVGFDVSVQTMGIAQANIYMSVLAQVAKKDALDVSDLRLYTTDSLDPRNGQYLKQLAPLFGDPQHREFLSSSIKVSAEIKQNEHFQVVIGNPPYKNNSDLTLGEVADRFPGLLAVVPIEVVSR